MRTVVRLPLALLAALTVVLGLVGVAQAADTSSERTSDQVWGFVDAPVAVSAGWQGPLTVAWRNASDQAASYEVTLVGSDLPEGTTYAESRTITTEAGGCFREELPLPALDLPGTYTARLTQGGVDLVVPVEIVVRRAVPQGPDGTGDTGHGVRVLDLQSVAGGRATSFRVSRTARVTTAVLDARGRTVRQQGLGMRPAGRTLRTGWDGRDGVGRPVAAGTYTIRVTAAAHGRRSSETVAVRVRR